MGKFRLPSLPPPELRLVGAPATLNPWDFVLGPTGDNFEGVFPTAAISLLLGPSGAGKSTLGIQMLTTQADGRPFLGRQTFRKTFLVVMQDRGEGALIRTLHRMKMPALPCVEARIGDPVCMLENVYLEKGRPQILFIEGLDMLVKDQSNMDAVSLALVRLRTFAEHYGVCIIGTVGSPKMKPKDRYTAVRDRAFGSAAWARMCDAIVEISNDPKTDVRTVSVALRNAPSEEFGMVFQDGLLVPFTVVEDEPEEETWWRAHPEATFKEVQDEFGVSRATAFRLIKGRRTQ